MSARMVSSALTGVAHRMGGLVLLMACLLVVLPGALVCVCLFVSEDNE